MVISVRLLPVDEVRRRVARLRIVLADCHGVLTDQGVYYSDSGELLKRFSTRDGVGVSRLRSAAIATAIITDERSPSVLKRADKLQVPAFLGVRNKGAFLDRILTELDVNIEEAAYIGDDVNDLGIIERIAARGLVAAPHDAMPDVRARVHYVTAACGGQGAFREFAEWILRVRSTTKAAGCRLGCLSRADTEASRALPFRAQTPSETVRRKSRQRDHGQLWLRCVKTAARSSSVTAREYTRSSAINPL